MKHYHLCIKDRDGEEHWEEVNERVYFFVMGLLHYIKHPEHSRFPELYPEWMPEELVK